MPLKVGDHKKYAPLKGEIEVVKLKQVNKKLSSHYDKNPQGTILKESPSNILTKIGSSGPNTPTTSKRLRVRIASHVTTGAPVVSRNVRRGWAIPGNPRRRACYESYGWECWVSAI